MLARSLRIHLVPRCVLTHYCTHGKAHGCTRVSCVCLETSQLALLAFHLLFDGVGHSQLHSLNGSTYYYSGCAGTASMICAKLKFLGSSICSSVLPLPDSASIPCRIYLALRSTAQVPTLLLLLTKVGDDSASTTLKICPPTCFLLARCSMTCTEHVTPSSRQ